MLHCCFGSVVAPDGWNWRSLPDGCGVPASRHMPSGLDGVREVTSTSVRFVLYANFCSLLPGSHGCICRLVPAAGESDPASMHMSVLVEVLYTWTGPPAMFWFVVWKVYVACSARAGTEPNDPVAWSVPCAFSSAYCGTVWVPPPPTQVSRFWETQVLDLPCGSRAK